MAISPTSCARKGSISDERHEERMRRITDFRVDTVEIDEAKYYSLPAKARQLIETYASFLPALHPGMLRFEMPVYRWDEIAPLIRKRI